MVCMFGMWHEIESESQLLPTLPFWESFWKFVDIICPLSAAFLLPLSLSIHALKHMFNIFFLIFILSNKYK